MQAYKTATRIEKSGELHLSEVPFAIGDEVEVIVLKQPRQREKQGAERYPLRGKPLRYEQPFSPVAEDDWEALR